ncbi:hypothetical protein U0070_000273, partial [Myodes glareolus]
PYLSVQIEPAEGSLAGGTWITVILNDVESSILYPNNGSQLEIDLVNLAVPALPRIPCDVYPVFVDLPVVTCQTRSLLSEAHAGLYSLEIRSGEQVLGTSCSGSLDGCTFKVSVGEIDFRNYLTLPFVLNSRSVNREWALRWIGRSTNVSYNSGSAKESKRNGNRQRPLLGKPEANVEVASVGVGTADWFDSWEQNGNEGNWQQKTTKLELRGGAKYYLEAEQLGIAPSRGMRIGVQIHNTWLNPDVVNTYLLEKHQIRARAQRLPEIQIQATIEELLAVKCHLEPVSAHILLRLGFEQGLEGSSSDGVLTSSTEPFCGRFSLGQLRHLILYPSADKNGYQLDQYPYFTCINLWDTCVRRSEDLPSSLANAPLLVHRIDILPVAPKAGLLYLDEIILADTSITVSQADPGTARPGGNLVESVSVVGFPPVYSIAFWLAGCGSELPLITACTRAPLEACDHAGKEDGQLHKLLQDNADVSTSGYLNVSDITVTKELNSCYEHVAVQVNDVPAHCSGSCSFQYLQESTPSVDYVSYSPGCDINLLVYFTGTGFPRDAQSLQVTVNQTRCEVIFSNETNVVCELDLLPVGVHQILMLVRPSGLAVNASGEGLLLYVEPRLDAVEPAAVAEIGGLWVAIRGCHLEGTSLVLFGTQSCAIDAISSSSRQIRCKVPPRGKDGYTVNVTAIIGEHSPVLPRALTYVSSLNPVVVSLSRNRSSIAGGEILFLGMARLANDSDLDVQIRVQNTSAQVLTQTAWGLELMLPPLPTGIHTISVFINGVSIRAQGVDLHIQYLTEVFSMEPCSGSLLVPPALNVTVVVNGLASKCVGNCTLLMQEEVTPTVVALTASISGSVTTVLMRCQRLGTTDAAPTVFVDDQLPCHTTFFNTSHVACQMSDLPPGLHYLSAVHTHTGYACLDSASRNFFIAPQVFDYFPKNCSIHGGNFLTIKGTALRGRNATFVYVGQRACLTVNISYELIQCILPAGSGSVALEIEVDGVLGHVGLIGYSSVFTPQLLSVSRSHDILTFAVAQISGAANVVIFIGKSPCTGVSGNRTGLQCMVPLLPAGEYPVTGYDHSRGWASSALILEQRATVTSVTKNFVSLASLCDLRRAEDSCEVSGHTYLRCDLTITMGTKRLPGSWPYLYCCEESPQCLLAPDHWAEPASPPFSGLFLSPKVERDEVLIYNSSCNITMETEAEMECETPNQPIIAKITEIQKSRGQNT